MKIYWILLLFVSCMFLSISDSAAQKALNAYRIHNEIDVDGRGDESVWAKAEIASDFVIASPNFGGTPKQKTKVRILYDDVALYVLAEMEEVSRDSIMTQLSQRDNLGNTDAFGVLLDTYGNGTDGIILAVGATGVQFDALKENSGNEDDAWDAVWFSEVDLREDGWTVEMKIPYSAIRFPKADSQEWVLNFLRTQARKGTSMTWNPIDPEQNGVFTQSGRLRNIFDIKPPVRLSFSPYFSSAFTNTRDVTSNPENSSAYSYSGGVDVKYGINDAFTLDMTLVPDFGQVESDDNVVNLSPFEVRFDEKRPFFTEGVDLFNKANILHTRRIGGQPVNFSAASSNLQANEEMVSNQMIPQLYNATKVSGRNSNGIGIGVLNAVEASTHAVFRNVVTGDLREFQTQPLTNYNVFVVDKNLKNNSSIALINTNVWRQGKEYYDANVTGLEFSLKDKKQSYELSGDAAYSVQAFDAADNNTGHKYSIELSKISGKFNHFVGYSEESPNYNPNDLGFLRAPNERSVNVGSSYQIFDPFGSFNRAEFWGGLSYSRIIEPNAFTGWWSNVGLWMQTKKFLSFNFSANYSPRSFDFFESRVDGVPLARPALYNTSVFISSDSRKKLAFSGGTFVYNIIEEGRWGYGASPNLRYRFNDRLEAFLNMSINMQLDDTGWVETADNGDIFIGQRDRLNILNLAGFNFNFTEKIGIDMRVRHLWERGLYQSFHKLSLEGDLLDTDYSDNLDFNFTFFNVDLNFNWRFAPGSDIIINWKNSISGGDNNQLVNISDLNYLDGISSLSRYPQTNSLSLRVVYFLDYLNIKKRF